MSSQPLTRLAVRLTTPAVLLTLCACGQGSKPGDLVGSYSVHGVLVENSCGTKALPTSSPLDFVVEIRLDSGVAYWMPAKASMSSGTLTDSGEFRFTMSDTQVVSMSTMTRQLEPGDFANAAANPDFDLQQTRACALTRKQTVRGSLARRIAEGMVLATARSKQVRDAGSDDELELGMSDDLDAEHVIEVAPTSGSDCNVALAALGGTFAALPCEARYLLNGSLDTSAAVTSTAGKGGSGGAASQPDAGR